jgi:hypothetical protein
VQTGVGIEKSREKRAFRGADRGSAGGLPQARNML